MNPLTWSLRQVFALGAVVCALLLGYALYSEIYLGLTPCPLCVFQRIAFIIMGVVFLIGALHGPHGRARWVYLVLILLGAAWGIATAGRQLWLQSLPADQVPSCGPGLGYLFDAFSWLKALKIVFAGSGECAAVTWRFLGLAMPAWTLIWYVVLALVAVWGVLRVRKPALAG